MNNNENEFNIDLSGYPILRLDQIPLIDNELLSKTLIDCKNELLTNNLTNYLSNYIIKQINLINNELINRSNINKPIAFIPLPLPSELSRLNNKTTYELTNYPSNQLTSQLTTQKTNYTTNKLSNRQTTELIDDNSTDESSINSEIIRKRTKIRNIALEKAYKDFGNEYIVAATEKKIRFYPKKTPTKELIDEMKNKEKLDRRKQAMTRLIERRERREQILFQKRKDKQLKKIEKQKLINDRKNQKTDFSIYPSIQRTNQLTNQLTNQQSSETANYPTIYLSSSDSESVSGADDLDKYLISENVNINTNSTIDLTSENSFNKLVDKSNDKSIVNSIVRPKDRLTDKSTNKPIDRPRDRSIGTSEDKSVVEYVDSTTDKSVDKLLDRPTVTAIDRSIIKPILTSLDKPVDISVDSLSNKLVDRSTDITVVIPIDISVDSFTDIITDKGVRRSTDKTINKSIDGPVDRSIDRSVVKLVEVSVDSSTDKSIDKLLDISVDRSIDGPTIQPIDRPIDKAIDKLINVPLDKPIDKSIDKLINVPLDKPIGNSIDRPIDIPIVTPISQITIRRVSIFRETTNSLTEDEVVNVNEIDSQSDVMIDSKTDSKMNNQLDSKTDSTVHSKIVSMNDNEIDKRFVSKVDSKINILLDLKSKGFMQLNNQLDNNLDSQLACQADSKLNCTVDNYIESKIVRQLDSTIDTQVAGKIVSYTDNDILSLVDKTKVSDTATEINNTLVNHIDSQLDINIDSEEDNKLDTKIDSYDENLIAIQKNSKTNNQIDSKLDSMVDSQTDKKLDSTIDSKVVNSKDITKDNKIDTEINKPLESKLDSKFESKTDGQIYNNLDNELVSNINQQLVINAIKQRDEEKDIVLVSKIDKQIVNKIDSNVVSQSTNDSSRKPLSYYFPQFSALFTATCRSQAISAERLVGLMRIQCKMYEEWIQIMSDYSTVFSEQRGITAISSSDDSSKMYNGNSRALHYRVKSSKPEVSNIITDVLSNLTTYQPTNQTNYPIDYPPNCPTNYPTSDLTFQLTDDLPSYPNSNRKNNLPTSQEWFELPNGFGLGLTWNLLWTWARPSIDPNQLLVWQKVNHFVDNKHLTHKDMLKKSISRYVDNHNSKISEFFDIMPATFILPYEYTTFLSSFLKYEQIKSSMIPWIDPTPNCLFKQISNEITNQLPNTLTNQVANQSKDLQNLWIVKPIGMSRGRGISVISQIAELTYATASVIQKYIEKPLLLDGYKFDLRLYVLVTSFQPLEAFLYRDGFARVSTEPYTTNPSNLTNKFIHLTNSSIQRHNNETSGLSDNDVSEGGSKICLLGESGLWSRLKQLYPQIDVSTVWSDISLLIVKSLVIVNDKIPNQPNSFEIFGYDVIIQDDFTPRLLEVNSSPSLARPHRLDQLVKDRMIYDTIRLLDIPMYDRKVLVDVVKRRLNEIVKMKVNWMNKHDSSLDDDLNDILGPDYVPRLYGELPNYLGNYEMLCPNTKLYDLVIRYKSKIIKSLKDS